MTTVASGAPFEHPTGIAIEPPLCRGTSATIVGSTGKDNLTGSPFADVIVGLQGKDTINGANGKDLICGGAASDTLKGGKGRTGFFGRSKPPRWPAGPPPACR